MGCLCMVSCLVRLIIKYCTINLMSSFEIWTGIRSLEQVLLRTIITLICTECMYLNIHFYFMHASYAEGREHSKHFSNIYNGSSPCSRSSVLTSLSLNRHAHIREVSPSLSLASVSAPIVNAVQNDYNRTTKL